MGYFNDFRLMGTAMATVTISTTSRTALDCYNRITLRCNFFYNCFLLHNLLLFKRGIFAHNCYCHTNSVHSGTHNDAGISSTFSARINAVYLVTL